MDRINTLYTIGRMRYFKPNASEWCVVGYIILIYKCSLYNFFLENGLLFGLFEQQICMLRSLYHKHE